jgi:CRP-like cAMP-binding protein
MPVEKLKGHEVFRLLSPKEIERLAAGSGVMHLKEGEKIYSDGTSATHLFLLLKGRVELRRPTRGGQGLLVDDLVQGSLFGVSSLTGIDRYLLDAVCVEDSEVLKVESKLLGHVLDENPVVGYALQKRVSAIFFKRYVQAMERLQTVAQALPVQRS